MWDSATRTLCDLTLSSLPTGLFICDAQGMIRFINTAYADYLRTSPKEAIGKHITEFIPDSGIPRVIKTGVPELGTWRIFQYSEKEQTIFVNRVPLRDACGAIVGAFSITLLDTPEKMSSLLHDLEEMNKKVSHYAKKIKTALASNYSLDSITGLSPTMQMFKSHLARYARTDAPVLILGATGTGKELAAGAVHSESIRSDGPFVCLNCAAIPKDLFESELFGYAPGAFSGANREGKIGMIELADQGTLFLDEIGDMPLQAQAKLLRFLEDRQITRVGGTRARSIDFRLVAATNRDLRVMINAEVFREDLYYRINPMTLHLPRLQERREDILPLVREMLRRMNAENVHCSDAVLELFQRYEWPGNIRELRNTITRALSLCQNNMITVHDLPPELLQRPVHSSSGPSSILRVQAAQQEADLILNVLRENHWNIAQSARLLGISRATFYEKLKKHGIRREKDEGIH